MKQILIFLFLLSALCLHSQNQNIVPDTLYVAAGPTDSTYLIYQGDYLPNLDTVTYRPIDAVFDTSGVVTYAFRTIKENEDRQGRADLIKIQADALTKLYNDVNQILQAFTGAGYLANATARYGARYEGYYVAQVGATVSYFRLKSDGTSVEVDETGAEIVGYNGVWSAITENRFRLVGHFPTGIVPTGSIFTRIVDQRFGSPGLVVQFEKLR